MASNEDRVGKFLRRLLERKSSTEIVQSLSREDKPVPPRVPGGCSVTDEALEGRWALVNIPEQSRDALHARNGAEGDNHS